MKRTTILPLLALFFLCSCELLTATKHSTVSIAFDMSQVKDALENYSNNSQNNSRSLIENNARIVINCTTQSNTETKEISVNNFDTIVDISFKDITVGVNITLVADLLVEVEGEYVSFYTGSVSSIVKVGENNFSIRMAKTLYTLIYDIDDSDTYSEKMANLDEREYLFKFKGTLTDNNLPTLVSAISYADDLIAVDLSQTTGLTTIATDAFANCSNLKSIVVPQSVTTIEASAFSNCTNLGYIELNAALENINSSALHVCTSLKKIVVSPDNDFYYTIDDVLFYEDPTIGTTLVRCPAGSDRISYVVPDNVVVISKDAFRACYKLETIYIGTGVNSIGSCAFYTSYNGCALTDIIFKDTEGWEYSTDGNTYTSKDVTNSSANKDFFTDVSYSSYLWRKEVSN